MAASTAATYASQPLGVIEAGAPPSMPAVLQTNISRAVLNGLTQQTPDKPFSVARFLPVESMVLGDAAWRLARLQASRRLQAASRRRGVPDRE